MDNYPTSDQLPLQMLSASQSKKRRNDSLEEDLAQLSDLLSHLSVSKRVCQGHSRDQSKSRSMITAATDSINLDPVVTGQNSTSIQCPTNEPSKHVTPPSLVHQQNPPKLEHSREVEHRRTDQPVLKDTGPKSKPLRRRAMPRSTDLPATLDGLPTELKLMILNEIPDLRSLSALIRASPLYSRAYFDVQEELFNKQTFKELERRGLRLLPRDIDLPRSLAWLEVSVIGGGPPPPDLGPALFAFYGGLEMGKTTRLSMNHCKALLTLSDLIGWERLRRPSIQEGPVFAFDTIFLRAKRDELVYCPLEKLQKVYPRGVAHYHVYVFEFLKSHGQPFELSEIETFRKVFALVNQKVFNFGPHQANPVNINPMTDRTLTEAQTAAAREVAGKFGVCACVRMP
ncbi:MAG: hypothetical protein Q9195_008678 [Heterodermia aff. obscurata]